MTSRRVKWLRRSAFAVAALTAGSYATVCSVPFPEADLARLPAAVVLADRTGEPLRLKLAAGGYDCRPGYVPDPAHWIGKAIVAAEDQRFWRHPGVDVLALARAVADNVALGRRVSGASTISTQVIRLAQPRRRTLGTKCVEAFRALQLERRYDKQTILGMYLDRAPFGGNLVGIEAAARHYFAKRPADLSLAEAALLAGLPQSPSRLRPDRHLARARQRQAYVLERMEACGMITTDERAAAQAQPLAFQRAPRPFAAPHFCEMVGVPARTADGAPLRTTLDLRQQRLAEDVLARHLQHSPINSGAIVLLEVRTGAVRALVGSPDYFARETAGQVNGATARRAAGSTLKPFAYALALDRGLITPGMMIPDIPTRYRDLDPRNFSPEYRGLVSVRDALMLSLNLPAIEVEKRVGQERFWSTLRALGLGTIDQPAAHYGLGLVLGNTEVRLLDLANAYACLARGGVWFPPRLLENSRPPAGRELFSPEACWLVAEMLSGEERTMDIAGHAADVRLPPMAWKTGTSAGLRDAWTVAWNPDYVIGVWLGNADGSPADELVGRLSATPIAWEVFRQLYPDNNGRWYARPPGIIERNVCAVSGCVPGANCPHAVQDWTIAKVTRHEPCPVHRQGPAETWPVAVASFLARRTAPAADESAAALRIRSPARGSTYRWLPDLTVDAQRLALDAASDRAGETLHWFVNDQPIGRSCAGEPLFWPLTPGTHTIVCSTARGLSDRIQIAVETQ